jgi:hypothetical protein
MKMWLFCVVTARVGNFAKPVLDFNDLWNPSTLQNQSQLTTSIIAVTLQGELSSAGLQSNAQL